MRQGEDGFWAAHGAAGKDRYGPRRRSRSGFEGVPSTALLEDAAGRMRKG